MVSRAGAGPKRKEKSEMWLDDIPLLEIDCPTSGYDVVVIRICMYPSTPLPLILSPVVATVGLAPWDPPEGRILRREDHPDHLSSLSLLFSIKASTQ